MATSVKADDWAKGASRDFLNVINNQLGPAFSSLTKAGSTLADPMHWEGNDAASFRSQIWPQAQKDIRSMQNALTDLQGKVDKVLGNIMAAGGNP